MDDDILKEIVSHMAPLIQMYGLYVVFHGHLTPGGGFSGGIVLALSMALFIMVFGMKEGMSMLVLPETPDPKEPKWRQKLCGVGMLMDMNARVPLGLIAGVLVIALKLASFFFKDTFKVPLGTPGMLFSSGLIFIISIGVGLVVASTILTLFILLVEEVGDNGTPAD